MLSEKELKNVAGLLVGCNFADSAHVAFIITKWFGYKKFYQVKDLFLAVLASSNSNNVCIVVFACQLGR